MTRTTTVSLLGIGLVALLLIGCVGPGLAVRAGLLDELVIWVPPQGRFQMVVRIGSDSPPWSQIGLRQAAVNVWLHDRDRENWHLISLVRVPLGGEPLPEGRPVNRWPSPGIP